MNWLWNLPFFRRLRNQGQNASKVPWGNQNIKTHIPNGASPSQLKQEYKNRVRQNIRYRRNPDPALPNENPWKSTPKGQKRYHTPRGQSDLAISFQKLKEFLKAAQNGGQAANGAKSPVSIRIPLPNLPKIKGELSKVKIPSFGLGTLGKGLSIAGGVISAAEATRLSWKLANEFGLDVWQIIGAGLGFIPGLSDDPRWRELAEAIIAAKQEQRIENGLMPPGAGQEEIQKTTYPFKGGQEYGKQYIVEAVSQNRMTSFHNGSTLATYTGYHRGTFAGKILRVRPRELLGGNYFFAPAILIDRQLANGTVVTDIIHAYEANDHSTNRSSGNNQQLSVGITSITRADGLADTGGNPPSTAPGILTQNVTYNYTINNYAPPTLPDLGPLIQTSPNAKSGIAPVPTKKPDSPKIPDTEKNKGIVPSAPELPTLLSPREENPKITFPDQTPTTVNKPNRSKTTPGITPPDTTTVTPGVTPGTTPGTTPTTPSEPTKEEKKVGFPIPKIPLIPPLIIPTGGNPIKDGSLSGPGITPTPPKLPPTQAPPETPCPCNSKVLQGQKDLGKKIDATNSAGQDVALAEILLRLGPRVEGGLSGFLKNFAKSIHLDKAINFMSLVFSIHNAYMLSRNFLQTTEELMTMVINFIGTKMKNEVLEEFDVSQAIEEQINRILKEMLGKENAESFKKKMNRLNRIYQAATNLLSTIEGMFWSLQNLTQLVGQYQGKIGNALTRSGVVLEGSYNWMQERFGMFTQKKFKAIDGYLNKVNNLEEVSENLTGIAGEIQSLDQQTEEFKQQKQELIKLITETEPDAQVPALKVQEKAELNKSGSLSPEVNVTSDGGQANE